jgi:predicted component of type VI protein secretion system
MNKAVKTDKLKPDVLRVTEYILAKAEKKESFGLNTASTELNSLSNHKIAKIMQDICLDPQEPGSLSRYTTIDNQNWANEPQYWQLNASSYFSYLSYLAIQQAEHTNKLTAKALIIAVVSLIITLSTLLVAA